MCLNEVPDGRLDIREVRICCDPWTAPVCCDSPDFRCPRQGRCVVTHLTLGVQGRPLEGAGVLGRGGVGGRSSSDPAFIMSSSAEISSSPLPLSNGSDMSYIPCNRKFSRGKEQPQSSWLKHGLIGQF